VLNDVPNTLWSILKWMPGNDDMAALALTLFLFALSIRLPSSSARPIETGRGRLFSFRQHVQF
jgi:hypothetical protein